MQDQPLVSPFGTPRDKLIIALDNVSKLSEVYKLIRATHEYASWYKVGLETITAFGCERMIKIVKTFGANVFNDGKYHDIPNTVGNTAEKVSVFNADMINVHCSSGLRAMKEAVAKKGNTIILGVTVLTSHTEEECRHIFGGSVEETVLKFARDAVEAGLDGIVCSAVDLKNLSQYHELDSLIKVTPGIQPVSMQKNDQARVMTPAEAIKLHASALVIGRAITESKDPGGAAKIIMEEIGEAMAVA